MAAEEVLLSIDTVRYKKNYGVLKLLSDRIVWYELGADSPKLNYAYSDIKVQRISPEGSSKVQLQTVLHDGNSYSFHFTNSSFPDAEKQDRDAVKELLSQLIPAHRRKANKELEEKTKFFQDNPALYQLYKDLVVSGVITAEEFWTNRGNGQTPENPVQVEDPQTVGLSSGFLSDVKPESSGCNELRYNLDADTIEAIFKTYPAVKRKHTETVPNQMTEKDFWTKFFQSHFFHRDRQKSSSDLFLECANHDEEEFLNKKLSDFYDRLLDISEPSPIADQGYGSTNNVELTTDKKDKMDNLFRRFNHQSSMVLKEHKESLSDEKQKIDASESPTKKARLREMVLYEDLEEEKQPEMTTLKIKEKSQFCNVTLDNGETESHIESNGTMNGVDEMSYKTRCITDIRSWQSDLTKALTSDRACEVLTEFSPAGNMMKDMFFNNNDGSSASLETELRQHYNAITELLRHFWSCFPVTSQFLEEKVERMSKCLEKYKAMKLQNFVNSLKNPKYGEHLIKMIDVAINKFQALQEKKTNKVQIKQTLLNT